MPIRSAMIAMTTRSSMSVNARGDRAGLSLSRRVVPLGGVMVFLCSGARAARFPA
jgi:hypothetical protein